MRPTLAMLLLASSLLAACGSDLQRPDPHTMAPTTIDKQIVGRTTLAMPISIPGSATVIVPFAIESEKDWFQTKDPYAAGGYAPASVSSVSASLSEGSFATRSAGGGSVRWHNAIVRNLKSGEQWPILEKRGVISSWQVYGPQPRLLNEPFKATVLLFLATLEDTNHDGVLNDLDASVAIVAGPDGRNPRVVSPPNAQVWSVAFDAENDKLYFMVAADTNADGKYDYKDAPTPYVCDASGSGVATPVVSEGALRRVEGLLK